MPIFKIYDTTTSSWVGIPSIQGLQGPAGPAGPTGPAGPSGFGIPSGGIEGQFLVKQSSTDYDVAWATVPNATGVNF